MTAVLNCSDRQSIGPTSKDAQGTLLTKRATTVDFSDLVCKKIKTKSTDLSQSISIVHSPSTEISQSKFYDSLEEASIMIDESLENERISGQKSPVVYTIPPFESCTQFSSKSDDLDCSTAISFSRVSSESTNPEKSAPVATSDSDHNSAQQLYEALNVLRMRFMAIDEADFLQEAIKKLFTIYEPRRIPLFAESTIDMALEAPSKRIDKPTLEIQSQSDVIYGQVEFPLLSLSAGFTNCQETPRKNILTTDSSKTCSFEEATQSSKRPKSSILKTKGEKTKLKLNLKASESKESSAVSEVEVEESKPDIEGAIKKSKKEKKIQVVANTMFKNKSTTKINGDSKKERSKEDLLSKKSFISKTYAFSMKQKKSRAERQRTRWESAEDGKFSISDYFTQVLNAGNDDPKKKIPVPIGVEYQADLSIVPFKQGETKRKKLSLVWDPLSYTENEFNNFLKNLKACLKTDVTQEKGISLLAKNNNNIKKALAFAKNNKRRCLTELSL